MIRSAISAFVVVCLCFAILQVPGAPQYAPLPTAEALAPSFAAIPLPSVGNCPGGVCPVPAKSIDVASVQQVSIPAVHWTYPGEVRSHLASEHGVNASGMTTAQAEALHDSLHNAKTSTPVVRYVQTVNRPIYHVAPVRTALQRVAPLRRVGNLLRGVRNMVSFRRCH